MYRRAIRIIRPFVVGAAAQWTADTSPVARPWPPGRGRTGSLLSSLFNAFPVVLAGPGFIAARSGALAFRQIKSLSPAPSRRAERLRRPFQESARRDFEPLAPNLFKLRQHLPFVKA